ncbi:peptidase, M23 family [Leptospira kirschneri str. 200803703]|uniref:Peptidase, M23 family n=1 Tax=Leptospira kirschneri serovar Bulgarica str. Nikolaevo TaxID=1240687 RepID=M6F000_9LEPT|nr:peptidase, M23 family [Leptospira kirschneri serovar Bim str. PUO 1247]EMK22073.1 peptidase, M23 family [Leptospira kirschneri serovar Bulgarica str. Nikolaevo]EMN25024.1 peptidase, M23 family [Leptospira kirschneri serovar Sokoine str. RM1]EMO66306.1 peptidase, M23 family [Leptospira kirschneri str. 200803703]EMO82226.1 peptidase, M23 family [Leptospira kirschneri str. 200801774]
MFFLVLPKIFAAGSQNLSFYTVQKGDTYFSLGKKLKVDYHKIMEWNGKKETDSLLPGEVLKIQKPANLENQKTVSKNTKSNLVSVESSKPNLRFPLKNRTPIQNHFTKLSFAPHKGILFKATRHAEVRPASPGKVLVVDEMEGYKKYIILEHKNGYSTVYANLKTVSVNEGETVDPSKILGSLESGKGLYFQLNHGSSAIDPGLQIR